MFPIIEHIDDVLSTVEGRSDFVVARKDGYTVIDYLFAGDDTFDHPMRRECRGLKFGDDGRLIARPFQKFFNVGEKPETQPGAIDLSVDHVVMDKLDGSMIHPAIVNGGVAFMTRMGATDIALRAQGFADDGLLRFCRAVLEQGETPIFEWCSPDNRIVVPYAEPKLSLLAIREMRTGEYLSWSTVANTAKDHGLSLVRAVDPIRDMASFIEHARGLVNAEGYVVRFADGLMVKIKADDYVLRHRSKDQIGLEKNALAAVLQGAVDDLIPLLPDHDADALVLYQGALDEQVSLLADQIAQAVDKAGRMDRKAFALDVAPMLPAQIRGCAFQAIDGKATPREAVANALLRCMGSGPDIEKNRDLLGNVRWSDFYSVAA